MAISRFTLAGAETAAYGSTGVEGAKIGFAIRARTATILKQKNGF